MHAHIHSPRKISRFAAVAARITLLAAFLALGACASNQTLTRQTEKLNTLGFKKIGDTWKLTLPDQVLFDFDKADVKPDLHASIIEVARQLLFVNITRVRVEGHTDNVGDSEYNLGLSLRRANNVAAILVSEGFPGGNVESRGYGSQRPVASNDSEEGRQQNRRVEIIVLSDALGLP